MSGRIYPPGRVAGAARDRMPELACAGGVILGIAVLLFVIMPSPGSGPVTEESSPAVNRNKLAPLEIHGFRMEKQGPWGIAQVLEGDDLIIQPRPFAVFNIHSINEAVVRNARYETHFYSAQGTGSLLPDVPAISPANRLQNRAGGFDSVMGLITRVVVTPIRIDVFQDGRRSVVLAAARGVVDKRRARVEFKGAMIKDASTDRFIKSDRILWDDRSRVFRIPGSYAIYGSGKERPGRAVEVDLDFNISPM